MRIIGQTVPPRAPSGFWGHPGLAPPVRQAIPPVSQQQPIVPHHGPFHLPPVTHPAQPVAQPPPVTHPTHPTAPPSPSTPPASHHRHRDYVFVESYGWWPSWFPYWEPYWFWYWQYLYDYYGGDANAEYAEYARDWALRAIAPQWGWY